MESKLIFSDRYVLNNYLRLIRLLLKSNKNKLLSIKTTINIKLANKKSTFRFYKRLIKVKFFNNLIISYLVRLYCLLKRYLINFIPWILTFAFNLKNLSFFIYHFLVLYRAIFLLKMILDWFPVKNWDRASPLKRFLRRVTIDWTRQFEKYFPSIFAWLIVINIIPIFLSLIESFYITHDFIEFPTTYNFDELLEFLIESDLNASKQKLI